MVVLGPVANELLGADWTYEDRSALTLSGLDVPLKVEG
jgi:hypothetical protein